MDKREAFSGFHFPDKESRVLREWLREREVVKALRHKKRLEARSLGFAGASVNRLTASLQQWSGSVNSDLDDGLVILRSRARALSQNTEFGRRFLSLVASNIVGADGPMLQVRAKNQNGTLDKPANAAIEAHWKRWGKRCELSGRMSLAHFLRVAVKSVSRDGETLIRVIKSRDLPYGMALQMLEADRLDESINQRLSNGNVIRMGVETDTAMRPVAYWIKSAHPGENYLAGPPRAERVPAEDMYHLFLVERAEQVRGYTWFHAVLLRANMLHGYEEAAVTAARIGAAKVAAFVRKDDTAAPPIGGEIADYNHASTGLPQSVVEPGEFMDLTGFPGVELQTWNPEYPHANFESFLRTCMHGLATGLDVATHNLSGDMSGVNYSSARIAELSERDMWRTLQAWLIDAFVEPLYREWLNAALLRGAITFQESGKSLPYDKYAKFAEASQFQGRRWQWVDPQKEVNASKEMLAAGLASRTQIVGSQGRDFEDVVAELEQEQQMLEAAGLRTDTGASAPPAPSPAPSQQSEDDGADTTDN